MKRKFRENVEPLQIQTPKGVVEVLPTSNKTAYVKVQGTVTIRGIDLDASCGFTIEDGDILSHYERSNSFSFKANRSGQMMVEAPAGATKELLEIMRAAVQTACETEPARFAEAGLIYASNNLFRVEEDIEKAEKALRDLVEQRNFLLAQEEEMERLVEVHASKPGMAP